MPNLHTPRIENYEARLEQLMHDFVASQTGLLPERNDSQRAVAAECIRYKIADTKAAIEEIRLGIA